MTTPVVPLAGFEPARCFHRGILTPLVIQTLMCLLVLQGKSLVLK